ncbi:MAG TPA: hypothetical protein VK832_05265 [Burkholderiaceae bacterium]|nr:hypothetical protein [Burkholderiaceae bacterium]
MIWIKIDRTTIIEGKLAKHLGIEFMLDYHFAFDPDQMGRARKLYHPHLSAENFLAIFQSPFQ